MWMQETSRCENSDYLWVQTTRGPGFAHAAVLRELDPTTKRPSYSRLWTAPLLKCRRSGRIRDPRQAAPLKLLVTGGAGYVGSVVANRLVEMGHETVVLGNLSNGHERAVPEGARFAKGDLLNARRLRGILGEGFGDPAVVVACSQRIRKELGWEPTKPDLETMISDAWDWIRFHSHEYTPSTGWD